MFNNEDTSIEELASRLDPIACLATLIEHQRMRTQLRCAWQPELGGIGTSYFDEPMARLQASAISLREPLRVATPKVIDTDALPHAEAPCKPHPLHGAKRPSIANERGALHHHQQSQTQKTAEICDFPACLLGGEVATIGATVHPLVKEERDNGRTDRSLDLTSGAMHRASSENSASAIRLVGFAHQDNGASTASRSAQLVLRKGALHLFEGNPPGDGSVIPLHGAEDAHPAEATTVLSPTTSDPAECPFDYLRFDYFDNGAPAASSKKQRARHVINVFAAASGSRSRGSDYRISFLSEARFFKRSVPQEVTNGMNDDFYQRIWAKYEDLRKSANGVDGAQVAIGHWKDRDNHVVPQAAAILVRIPGLPPAVIARFGAWGQKVDINTAAKGTRKCRNLVGLGYARQSSKKQAGSRAQLGCGSSGVT